MFLQGVISQYFSVQILSEFDNHTSIQAFIKWAYFDISWLILRISDRSHKNDNQKAKNLKHAEHGQSF